MVQARHHYDGQRVAVLGMGGTGLSFVRHLRALGARLSAFDEGDEAALAGVRSALPEDVVLARIDGARDRLPADIDWVALSPGFPRAKAVVRQALARGLPVRGDIELFAHALPSSARVLSVTGSNGKSTTTALAEQLARIHDPSARAAGNIGEPVLDALAAAPATATWVLELSSFQLESTWSLVSAAATVLNVSPNHLDRYDSFFAYAAAKARVFDHAQRRIINRDCAWSSSLRPVQAERGQCVSFGLGAPPGADDYGLHADADAPILAKGSRAFCEVGRLRLHGRHQHANALAALALAECATSEGWTEATIERAAEVLAGFRGLPHRMAALGQIDGVRLIDDSKATTVVSTSSALTGLAEPVHLIAGGDGKGQSFEPLGTALSGRCRSVYLIGKDAGVIAAVCASHGVPARRFASLEEATGAALDAARPGEVVLLSPACASWDMFRSYVERANVFATAAMHWAQAHGRHFVSAKEPS